MDFVGNAITQQRADDARHAVLGDEAHALIVAEPRVLARTAPIAPRVSVEHRLRRDGAAPIEAVPRAHLVMVRVVRVTRAIGLIWSTSAWIRVRVGIGLRLELNDRTKCIANDRKTCQWQCMPCATA